MEPPPSRSSSTSDCKSLCLPPLDAPESPPTPDSVDAGSEASWCPAAPGPCSLTEAPGLGLGLGLGLGPGPGMVVVGGASWRERAETEASLRRLLPTLDALLQQLDRVTMATEDLYHTECRLQRAHGRTRSGGERPVATAMADEGQEVRERPEDRDPGRAEKKGGKQKEKASKKKDKTRASKKCKGTEGKKTPTAAPTAVPTPFSRSALTPGPAPAARSPAPPTPASPPHKAASTKTLLTHILPSKISPICPYTP